MQALRSLMGFFCFLAALLVAGGAVWQVREEGRAVLQSWPDIDQPPQVVEGDESPSDRDVQLPSPLETFVEAFDDVVPWCILAAALLANATLLGVRNAVERE